MLHVWTTYKIKGLIERFIISNLGANKENVAEPYSILINSVNYFSYIVN